MAESFFYTRLSSRKKLYIQEFARVIGAPVRSNLNKDELALAVSDYILKQPQKWMQMLTLRDFVIIEELLKHEAGYRYTAGFEPVLSHVAGFGLTYHTLDENGMSIYWVDEEMLGMYKRGYAPAKAEWERKCFKEYEMFAMGALHLYGIIGAGAFFDILMKAEVAIEANCVKEGRKNFDASPLEFITNSLLCRLYQYEYEGKIYNFNPNMPEPGRIIAEQMSRKEISNYKEFSMVDIFDAGRYSIISAAGYDLPESKEMMKAMGIDINNEFEASLQYHDFFVAAQEDPNKLISIVSKIKTFKSLEELNRAVAKITAFSNAIPRWELKGYSSEEIFKKFEKPQLRPLPKKEFTTGNPFANVRRNDPCPCGSGKKYKNCHGLLS